MKKLRKLVIGATLLAGSVTSFSTSATVTIGEGRWGNCMPFGCEEQIAVSRYQQVYSAAAFTSAQTINTAKFYKYPGFGALLNSGSYTLSLSTTSRDVGALDSNLSSNIGLDQKVIGTFNISGVAPREISFFGSEFDYDPARGNLLLDIVIVDVIKRGQGVGNTYFDRTDNGLLTSVAFEGAYTGQRRGGLITTFEFLQRPPRWDVPEPMTAATFSLGLFAMAAVRRRKMT